MDEFDEDLIDSLVDHELNRLARDMSDAMDAMLFARLKERYCIYCNGAESKHKNDTMEYSDGHPFFKDNLEYLEWESQKKV